MAQNEIILKLGDARTMLATLNGIDGLRDRLSKLDAQFTTATLAIAELTRRIEVLERKPAAAEEYHGISTQDTEIDYTVGETVGGAFSRTVTP